MKRKIQHDAINNQEDEDSSAYPIYPIDHESPEKKAKKAVKNNAPVFPAKESSKRLSGYSQNNQMV